MANKKKKKTIVATRKTPMRSAKKNRQKIATFKASKESEKCKQWLLEQKYFKQDWIQLPEKDDELISNNTEEAPVIDIRINRTTRMNKFKNLVYYECEWKNCNAQLSDQSNFNDHVVKHYSDVVPNEDLYECLWDLCDFVIISDINALKRHLSYHAYHSILKTYGDSVRQHLVIPQCAYDSRNRNHFIDSDNDYYCHWEGCNKVFNLIHEFFEHVRKSHCSSRFYKKDFVCLWYGCHKKINTRMCLVTHMKVHTKECGIACSHCGVTFKQNYKFLDHCRRQFVNNTHQFQCDQCYKYFATERLLRDHMRLHVNYLKCTLCDMSCSHPGALATHIRYKHMDERPFACNLCAYRAVTKRDLVTHMSKHYDTAFDCQEYGCNFTCKSNYLLKKHDAMVHGSGLNTYECHCCHKNYNYSISLSRHLKEKHKFQYPSGHSRFTYKQYDDGIYRLQTMRVESLEVTKQIILTDGILIDSKTKKENKRKKRSNKINKEIENCEMINNDKPNVEDHYDVYSEYNECENSIEDENKEMEMDSDEMSMEFEFNDIIQTFDDANDNCSIKNIDNFKVMKYLKDKKPIEQIEININDVDSDGKIIKSGKIRSDIIQI